MKVIFYEGSENLNKCKKLIAVSILPNSSFIIFIKNGMWHNTMNYAFYHNYSMGIGKSFYYKDIKYESDNGFTIKSWKKYVKKLRQEERLKIFK